MHQPKARADPARLAELLHPDFHEIGRSGRAYTRAEMLAKLPAETMPISVQTQDFSLKKLAENVYMLSYRSAHLSPDGSLSHDTHRTSIWRLESSGWQMMFHQGTPTTAAPAAASMTTSTPPSSPA